MAVASQQGCQVVCLDAPLRLQEAWVRDLVRGFKLSESDKVRQLGAELAALSRRLPESHVAWDQQVAAAVFQQQQQQRQRLAAAAAAADPGPPAEHDALEEADLEATRLACWKASRAVAAALLPPGEAHDSAVRQQAQLQPLKFALFDRRARHMGRQLLEFCDRLAAADSHRRASSASTHGAVHLQQAAGEPWQAAAPASSRNVVVVVAGRQYLGPLRALWADPRSVLWRGQVPRTFAATCLEGQAGEVLDPEVERGGSRPTGKQAISDKELGLGRP